MNMQAMMQQAQKLQRDLMKSKQEIEEKHFISKQSLVEVEMKGNKEVVRVSIDADTLDKEDIEMLEDLILTCVNEALRKVDSAQSQEFGKFNIPGLM